MRRDIIFFGFGVAILTIVVFGYMTFDKDKLQYFFVNNQNKNECSVQSRFNSSKIAIPFTGKSFVGFKQALSAKESLGSYDRINDFGYLGKYQFGKSTLRNIGIYNFENFLINPILQEMAFETLLSINKWELRKEIDEYSGKLVCKVLITESGLLAAAHLGGASSVKKFLRSNGTNSFNDGFGTSIKTYLNRFSGYDTSIIRANRFARIVS
jgi:hypothetical protein